MRRIITCLISAVAVLGLAIAWQYQHLERWWTTSATNPYISTYIQVQPGQSLTQVAHQLQALGLINNAKYFVWLVRLHHATQAVKAGDYLIHIAATPQQIFIQLHKGKVLQFTITLVEGRTFNQLLADMAKQPLLKHDITNLSDADMMQQLGVAEVNPEGLFFPDTYFYPRGFSEKTILQRAYQKMQTYLTQAWAKRDPSVPYTDVYQALIAASIIEKESANSNERPLIASVIINRLQKGMPLQMDPTVIYGLGPQFNGNITVKDLQTATPYNTYTKKGLPPTPIAMPSASSIQAALHPASTNYLYFVAKGSDGTHQFSTTLGQHDKAVKQYLQWQKQQTDQKYEANKS